jgi:N-acetylglucosamine kinase-like BadF-type ATPase
LNPAIGLGIDAGGTGTRWALIDADNRLLGEGRVAGMTALQMSSTAGRENFRDALMEISNALPTGLRSTRVCAGMTGFSEGGADIGAMIAGVFAIDTSAISLKSDIEIACLDLFAPGEGYVVYAGTGSIAAFIDDAGNMHRAGGHGVTLDDAGGGFWIAVEALRHIWRNEDARPGAWRDSPMAVAMFDYLGGNDWATTREFVYHRGRGDIGKLALVVAATAEKDTVAHGILKRAGSELARLGQAMISRFGERPIALAGRVFQLHPVIEDSVRASLPANSRIEMRRSEAHVAAARIAARMTLRKNP